LVEYSGLREQGLKSSSIRVLLSGRVYLRNTLSPFQGLVSFPFPTHGLRRGLRSAAASRLKTLPRCARWTAEGGCPYLILGYFLAESRSDLLRYNAAGDAVTGVSGGIGLHVVSFGMDDDCGTSVGEERVRTLGEGHVFVLDGGVRFSFRIDGEVQHIAGVVAFRTLESMLFAVGIEVRAGRLEIGSIAFWVLMKVDGVLAKRKIVQLQLEGDTGSFWRKGDGADVFPLGILELDFGFGGARKNCEG